MPIVFSYLNILAQSIPLSVSYVDVATSTASTIVVPNTIQAGDIAILIQVATSTGTPTDVNPTGFTALSTNTGAIFGSFYTNRTSTNYKILDGTEGGATLTGINGNTTNSKYLYIFRPNIPAASVSVTRTYQATDNDPTQQSIIASGEYPMIFIAFYGSNAAISTRTFSPSEDAEVQISTGSYSKYKIYNSSASDTTIDMPDAGSNILFSARFNIT